MVVPLSNTCEGMGKGIFAYPKANESVREANKKKSEREREHKLTIMSG